MRKLIAILMLAVFAAGASACGGNADAEPERPPREVPMELAPQSIRSGDKTLQVIGYEGDGEFIGEEKSLAVDGKLWEFRDGQRLVGTLQITTTKWKLDLEQERYRQPIISQVMPAARRTINVEGVRVYVTSAHDKVTYLWFGEAIYQVVQLKGDTLDPEAVLDQIISHQLNTEAGEWIFREDAADEV